MSHHASGPNFGFPRGDARLDMTDLYAFPKPGDPSKSIMILNVHPSGVVAEGGLAACAGGRRAPVRSPQRATVRR